VSQSIRWSVIETVTQMVVGQIIAFSMQLLMFWFLDIPVSMHENIIIAAAFFCSSTIRSYVLRRLFNRVRR
jgi:hypothetical protein